MAQDNPQPVIIRDRKLSEMSLNEKLVFMAKACVFLVSGGFIYPTIWID